MEMSLCLQGELRVAIEIQSLRCSDGFQHHLILFLLHIVPQLLSLKQPLYHCFKLQKTR